MLREGIVFLLVLFGVVYGATIVPQEGYTCVGNNPCTGPDNPGTCNFHFPHVDSSKFVQCNEWGGQCFEMDCPAGQQWFQDGCYCGGSGVSDPCIPNPCRNGGTCTSNSQDGSYTCSCTEDYTGPNCEVPAGRYTCAEDNNPCTGPDNPGNCNFHFAHVDSSRFVQCNEWGTQCFEMDCPTGLQWHQSGCYCGLASSDPCSPNPCQNGGSCIGSVMRQYQCNCPDGFTGEHCEIPAGGYTCAEDNNPCTGPDNPGSCNFHFTHVDSGKFVQCNEWGTQCFEMDCPAGLQWHQSGCYCG